MRRTLPILAIVLFAAAACNGGAAPRAAVSGPETIANQAAPAAGQQPGPIDESYLLTCFQGTHAAECTICLREGYQAWVDFQAGRPVEQTQQVVDAMYHQGAPPPSLPSGV